MPSQLFVLDENRTDGERTAGYLASNGFAAEIYADPAPVLASLDTTPPHLILVQLRPAGPSGLDILRRIRARSAVPCILRAAERDDEVERILGLESGADDYVPSSASHRELLARIRTVLRRAAPKPSPQAESGWRLSAEKRDLFGPEGTPRRLTSAEFDLLSVLVRAAGSPVSREVLSQAVFRRPYYPEDRAVDNVVVRLRRKIGQAPDGTEVLKAVRSVGYVFLGFPEATINTPFGCAEFCRTTESSFVSR